MKNWKQNVNLKIILNLLILFNEKEDCTGVIIQLPKLFFFLFSDFSWNFQNLGENLLMFLANTHSDKISMIREDFENALLVFFHFIQTISYRYI